MGDARTLRIAVAGLGTVGGGLLKLLDGPDPVGGGRLRIVAVSARDRHRRRESDISALNWFDDAVAMAREAEVDVFVELMGGSDGPAKAAVEAALKRGLPVVTANKALLAEHGLALATLAEATGAHILYEAAVAGGIPVIKALRDGLAGGNRIDTVAGILNGTCNYLLTEMESSGRAFEDVLADAQRLGYAEADPTTDVGGFDAGHKIALLAAVAFGAPPAYAAVEIEGVENVTLLDIRLAGKLGYRIKLIAKAERVDGSVRAHVGPALVAFDHPLAAVGGSLNAVVIDGDPVGRLSFVGGGAGAGPTASAVAADLLDLLAGDARPPFGRPVGRLVSQPPAARAEEGRFFLRILVHDKPGVIAAVADQLARAGVSIESFLQDPAGGGADVPIVLTTQRCPRGAVDAAVRHIAALDVVAAPPRMMPIEETRSGLRAWS
ncbi:MAG: homoserine dehydrogenase [Hyphomonadaceae bacterium]|nr:homoserine dehydrogenase [Hyphomonadaceae bacterium]